MKNTSPDSDFQSFALPAPLVANTRQADFTQPTDIQRAVVPAALAGKDVLARADTGSGKTVAFVLPLLANLSARSPTTTPDAQRFNPAERARDNGVQVLVLVPTRELAIQVAEVFEQFAAGIQPAIRVMSVYGGVKINPQMMALRGGADVLVATPGRLLDLAAQHAIRLGRLKALVVDEVDRLMKGDFADEIERIARLLPNQRQNLMFTATFPDTLRPIVRKVMRDPVIINLDANGDNAPELDEHVVTVNREKKNDLLAYLLTENDWQQVLIFCSAKRTCDNLVIKLAKRGIDAVALHGNKAQSDRMAAMRDFKAGKMRILIATDVAARGIDIDYLPCVINFDLPRSPNDYVHRIGRTARAGRSGQAITLLSHDEYQHFRVIEKRNGYRLEREQVAGFEADEAAPPMPTRNGTRRKLKSKTKTKTKTSDRPATKKTRRQTPNDNR